MKSGKTMLLFLTGFLFVVAGWLAAEQIRQDAAAPLSVEIAAGADVERIQSWADAENNYYIFLPSYADLPQTRIRLETGNPVYLDDELLSDGLSCENLRTDTAYALTYTAWGRTQRCNITFVQSGNVPALYVDTASGSMDYIHAEKGNEETGEIRLYAPDGALEYEGNLNSINGRGNNTWEGFEKKPYSIELSAEADLLGMGSAQKWILLANASDPSNLRNKIGYDFAGVVGLAYSPESRWVDLYTNGEYAGLYLLCERNEVHPERVNVSEDGSFLISMEIERRLVKQNYAYVLTDADQAFRIHYPEANDEMVAALTEVIQSVENGILAEDGIDSSTGTLWTDLIDLDSWVRKYLVEEVFANGDASYISQYFYLDGSRAEKKVFAGPIWDFDHALGQTGGWQRLNPQRFYANNLHALDGDDTPWFYSLYRKGAFYDRVTELYRTDFLPLIEELLNEGIGNYVDQIRQASAVDQIRWGLESDVLDEQEYITSYLLERIDFLSSVWIDHAEYLQVQADQGFGAAYGYFAVPYGGFLPELPVFEDTETLTFRGWYYEDTNEPVDISKSVYEEFEIYAKWQDKPSRSMNQIVKLIPLGVLAGMFMLFFIGEIRRMKRSM